MLVWLLIGWEFALTAVCLLALVFATRKTAQVRVESPDERVEATLAGLAIVGIIAIANHIRFLAAPGEHGELLALGLMIGGVVGVSRAIEPLLADLKLGVYTRTRDRWHAECWPELQIMIRRFEQAYAQVMSEQLEAEAAARRPLSTRAIRRLSILGTDIELGSTTIWRSRSVLLSVEECAERLRSELQLTWPVARPPPPPVEPPITVSSLHRTPPLTQASWASCRAPGTLIQHAAPRIPRRHLALILADLTSTTWPVWHRAFPDDWAFALRVAALRGWAIGEVSLAELGRLPVFEDDDEAPWHAVSDSTVTERPEAGAAAAIACALRAVSAENPTPLAVRVVEVVVLARAASSDVAAARNYQAWVEALDAESEADWARDDSRPDEVPVALLAAEEERREAEEAALRAYRRAWRDGLTSANEDCVSRIRAATPFRAQCANEWRVVPEFVISDGALLRLEDGTIVDSALMADLGGVEAERAVAFDAALERGGLVLFQRPVHD